ncbi:hypothetical protein ACFIOY_29485 [Bradyrhizobium sp. TZ2]
MVSALITVGEILKKEGDIAHLQIAAPPKLRGDVYRYVLGPAFGGIESDDADRVAVLAGEKVLDNGLQVVRLVVDLGQARPDSPKSSATK